MRQREFLPFVSKNRFWGQTLDQILGTDPRFEGAEGAALLLAKTDFGDRPSIRFIRFWGQILGTDPRFARGFVWTLDLQEGLYEKNPDRWAGHYALALDNLSSSYYVQNRVSEAIESKEFSLKILHPLYEKKPDRWAKHYTRAINDLPCFYKEQNRVSKVMELQELSLKILHPLYEKKPGRWAEDYTTALKDLGISYYQQNEKAKAYQLFEKSYQESAQVFGEEHLHTQRMKANYLYLKPIILECILLLFIFLLLLMALFWLSS